MVKQETILRWHRASFKLIGGGNPGIGQGDRRLIVVCVTLSSRYGHTYGTTFASPNFSDIAKACNVHGIRVSDPKDVETALRQGLAATAQRPALVEVMVGDYSYPKI